MSKLLIIGPTGNVGSSLARLLSSAGLPFRALIRNPAHAKALPSLSRPVLGDLSRPETLKGAFAGVERVLILAPPIASAETLEHNAFEAAVEAGVKRIVYLSNYGAAEGHDDLHYHVHGKHERTLAQLNVDWTVLRPTRFMPFTPFVWPSVIKRGLLIEGSGDGQITTIDPDDIAAVAFKALTEEGHEGRSYDLTSEDAFTATELAGILSRALGREVTVFDGELDTLRAALIENGAPPEYAPLMAAAFQRTAEGGFRTTDTASRVLGRPPRAYANWLAEKLPGLVRSFGDSR